MRKSISSLTTLALAWGCAATVNSVISSAQAATLSWRFAGLNAVRENKDLVTWREVTGLPEFAGFNSNLVQRVALSLAKPLARDGSSEADVAKSLMPISADLVAYPTVYELNGQADSNTWALAIQIPAERHEIWKSSWASVEKGSKATGAKLSREGNWTLLGNGDTKAALEKAKQTSSEVLHITGDALWLKKLIPSLKPARSELKVTVRGKGLRSEGKAEFEQDLPFKLSPWQVPTNTIREPLIGFTAIQGVADQLSKFDVFKKHPAPNQLFVWNEKISFFSMYVAAKVDDSKAFIMDATMNLNLSELNKKIIGNFEFDTNNFGLYLTGLPVAVPFLRPAHSNDVNFVYAGTMPMSKWASNSIPPELVREVVSRTNLVYYDWELGWGRLPQIRPLSQIAAMATRKPIANLSDPANKWLTAAEQKFQNTITEVTKTGPRELSLVRSSDSGFSAMELFAFVQWVAGPGAEPVRNAANKAPKPPAP